MPMPTTAGGGSAHLPCRSRLLHTRLVGTSLVGCSISSPTPSHLPPRGPPPPPTAFLHHARARPSAGLWRKATCHRGGLRRRAVAERLARSPSWGLFTISLRNGLMILSVCTRLLPCCPCCLLLPLLPPADFERVYRQPRSASPHVLPCCPLLAFLAHPESGGSGLRSACPLHPTSRGRWCHVPCPPHPTFPLVPRGRPNV